MVALLREHEDGHADGSDTGHACADALDARFAEALVAHEPIPHELPQALIFAIWTIGRIVVAWATVRRCFVFLWTGAAFADAASENTNAATPNIVMNFVFMG